MVPDVTPDSAIAFSVNGVEIDPAERKLRTANAISGSSRR